jgi:hypothetical protein
LVVRNCPCQDNAVLVYIGFEVIDRLAHIEAVVEARTIVNPRIDKSVVKESSVLIDDVAVFVFDDKAVF